MKTLLLIILLAAFTGCETTKPRTRTVTLPYPQIEYAP